MNVALSFTRVFFTLLSTFFITAYTLTSPGGSITGNALVGIGTGLLFSLGLITFDTFFKRFNLRAFNIAVLGLFLGYLMGQGLVLVFDTIVEMSSMAVAIAPQLVDFIKLGLFLFGLYIGTVMTLRSADELHVSLPFVKLTPLTQKKKNLLIDISLLSDARIIDLCSSGLLDQQLIIPRFIVKELYTQSEIGDEAIKVKARRCLEIIKKIEAIPHLDMRYNETDFSEIKDISGKLIRLARQLDANILSADITRVQMSSMEGVRIINIHALSNALKPLMQTGEIIKIKIQRYGKEPRQGIGYLEDGTMVVVNGGGGYIGEIIDTQVLSVKHTSSGRMIFCNALDEETTLPEYEEEFENER